jgi:hypothetical protein
VSRGRGGNGGGRLFPPGLKRGSPSGGLENKSAFV